MYKTVEKDVNCIGYNVLNTPYYGGLDFLEAYISCISLTEEEGKKILINSMKEVIEKRVDFLNKKLIALQTI